MVSPLIPDIGHPRWAIVRSKLWNVGYIKSAIGFQSFSPARRLCNLDRIYVSHLRFGQALMYMTVVARDAKAVQKAATHNARGL
jgi:hypothetical protein